MREIEQCGESQPFGRINKPITQFSAFPHFLAYCLRPGALEPLFIVLNIVLFKLQVTSSTTFFPLINIISSDFSLLKMY